LADTHGIAKYARTFIRDTHTGTHTKKEKVERLERGKKIGKKNRKPQKKKMGSQERKKEGEKQKGRKEKGK